MRTEPLSEEINAVLHVVSESEERLHTEDVIGRAGISVPATLGALTVLDREGARAPQSRRPSLFCGVQLPRREE